MSRVSLKEFLKTVRPSRCAVTRAVALFYLGSIACGCARDFPFRLVDGRTGVPLQGVTTERDSKWDDVILGSKKSSGQLPPSGVDGMVNARNLPANWVHMFIFRRAGYQDAEAIWDSSRMLLLSPSPGLPQTPFTEARGQSPTTIPMYAGLPSTEPASGGG